MNKKSITLLILLISTTLNFACTNKEELAYIKRNIKSINKKLKVLGTGDTKYKSKMSLADALHKIDEINKKLEELKNINTIKNNQANIQATMDEQIGYTQELNGILEDLKSIFQGLEDQISAISKSVDKISTTNEGISKLHSDVSSINEKVSQLKEINEINLEEESKRREQNLNETNSRVEMVEKKIDDLINVFAPKKKQKKTAKKPKQKKIEPFSSDSYKKAYSKYLNGEFDNAIVLFEGYLLKNPNTRLADNAQYWLGESFYSKMAFKKALNEFNNVVKNFPKSDKVSSALLKSAYSLDMLKQHDQAMGVLSLLIEKYPKSNEATLGQAKIDEIKKKLSTAN